MAFFKLVGDDLKKINIIKKNRDYDRIIKANNRLICDPFILYIEKVDTDDYHFGFSVGKKIGNAVTRNKIRRRLKSIIDQSQYKKGFNCIIMVRRGVTAYSYDDLALKLNEVLRKGKLIDEKK